jgi:short subunit fatty acids transporter
VHDTIPFTLSIVDMMPFVIPIVAIVCVFAVGIMAMFFQGQAKERAHRERMFLAEKGMEIPPQLYEKPRKKSNGYRSARAWLLVLGTTLILIGFSVMIAVGVKDGANECVAGVPPLFIGIAFLISERLISRLAAGSNGAA